MNLQDKSINRPSSKGSYFRDDEKLGKESLRHRLVSAESSVDGNNKGERIVVFHVDTVVPRKCRKVDIFTGSAIYKTHDIEHTAALEQYGLKYSLEYPSLASKKHMPLDKGQYERSAGIKARVVLDVNKINRYKLEPEASKAHRNKMIQACPKLKMLYQLKRDITPQTNAIRDRKCLRKSL